jgi:rubrerythrin
MDPVFDLATVDTDGAIGEAEQAIAGQTRSSFFRKAAVGGGAVLGSSAFLGMLPELAMAAPSRKQDRAILNYALTLEYLEAAFYNEALAKGKGFDAATAAFAETVALHENTHVTALKKTIKAFGGKPVAKPTFDFKGTTEKEDTFLATSLVLENTGVHAYLGQAGRLQSKALLAAAASIVTVEARHASAVAILVYGKEAYGTGKKTISPDGSFDTPLSKKQVLAAVGKTGFITG